MSTLDDLLVASGKVREIYDMGDDTLLLVASDRMSAFDVILPTPIPDKGRVLTGMTRFWLDRTSHIVAISGFNVSIVIALVVPILGRLFNKRP